MIPAENGSSLVTDKVKNLIESIKSNNKYSITNVKRISSKVLKEISDDSEYFSRLLFSLRKRADLVVNANGGNII